MSYCTQCGKKMVKEPRQSFDSITGIRNHHEVCSVAPCEHDGHDYVEIEAENKGILASVKFLAILLGRDEKYRCRRCGKEIFWSP